MSVTNRNDNGHALTWESTIGGRKHTTGPADHSTPIERVLAALEAHGCEPKQTGGGWSAKCPAHEDNRPSLSISVGDDGRVLIHCHAGCDVDAVCSEIGLTQNDLFESSTASTSTKPRKTRVSVGCVDVDAERRAKKRYPTAEKAIASLEQQLGPRSAKWTYHDANGDPVGMVIRWDGVDGKKIIRPVSRDGDGWTVGGMPEPRPLYGLSELADAGRIYVTEGEKAADAARSIGLVATTSPHGSGSAGKTDWSPLAGKETILLPDFDEPGRKYAGAVMSILVQLSPAPTVKVVELPDLPDHGDIVDWIAAQPDTDADELRRRVEALVDSTDADPPVRPEPRIQQFQPFPTNFLPEPVHGFVEACAKAIGCCTSFIALPLLAALASAIGNTRRIRLKRGWSAPAIVWAAIVGESGTSKTPAHKVAMRALYERQRRALAHHTEEMKQFKTDLAYFEKAMTAWKRDKKTDDPPPEEPEPPHAERCVVGDVTVEALAPLLLTNPRGLLLDRDELAGWLCSFDRYAGGKGGGDAAHWLSMFSGEGVTVDRKTGNPRTIYVPQASVCICGGIQPAILNRALGVEHRESGMAARLLLVCPPRKPKRWTEADIDPAAEAELARLVDRLFDLQPTVDDEGEPRPVVVSLSREAKAAWKSYYNDHAQEQAELTGDLAAAWSKLEEYAARLALVIHFTRWAADDPTLANDSVVDAVSMESGIALAQWFKAEARRVYSLLGESDGDREQRRLVEWVERKGGSVAPREVQQGHRQYRTAQDAEDALGELVKAGCGQWHDIPAGSKGGRPSRVFRLSTPSTSTKPRKTRVPGGCVDVDTVDAPRTQHDGDWGEL